MHGVTVESAIDAAAESIWAVLSDFGSVDCYHPRVETSRITGETGTGLGAQRVCELVDGHALTETIISYEEGRGYTTEVRGLTMPLKRVFGRVELLPDAGSGCRLRLGVDFEPRFGPLGWLLAVMFLKPMMRHQLRRTLRALDHYLRTGHKMGADGEHNPENVSAEPRAEAGPAATAMKSP